MPTPCFLMDLKIMRKWGKLDMIKKFKWPNFYYILSILMLITLLSCGVLRSSGGDIRSSQRSVLSPQPLQGEPPFPTSGKASLMGVLYSFTGKGPIPNTVFYLVAVDENAQEPPRILMGPREEAGDIRGVSDQNGKIEVRNIPPGNYYLAVWAPYDWILAVVSESDHRPLLIKLNPNERLNLGIIYVPWPH